MSVLLALVAPAWSQVTTVRKTTLVDGRSFVSEVLGTEATGLRVRVPAGEMLVSFEELSDLRPADPTTYAAQPAWRVVLLAPEATAAAARDLLQSMTGVVAVPVGSPDPAIPPGTLEGCTDVTCLATRLRDRDLPWHWVVSVAASPEGAWVVSSLVSTAPTVPPRVVTSAEGGAQGLWLAYHEALHLSAPTGKAPPVAGFETGKAPKPGRGPAGPVTAEQVASWSYVPLPGYSAFRQGDGAGGALSVLGTVAAAGLVGVGAGFAGQSGEGFDAGWAAVGGASGLVVGAMFTNNWLGTHAFEGQARAGRARGALAAAR